MADKAPPTDVQNRTTTSLRIGWRSLTAEANGIPAIGIVVTAMIVVIVMLLWWSGPLHYIL